MPLFSGLLKQKPKTPTELIAKCNSSLQALATAAKEKDLERASKDTTENLALLNHSLMGEEGSAEEPQSPLVDATMAALLESDTLLLMVQHLGKLDFETRKDVVAIFAFASKYRVLDVAAGFERNAGLDYVAKHPELVQALASGYEDASTALNCGSMLRDSFRDPAVVEMVLYSTVLDQFFKYVQKNAFEVASDAFNSFKKLLTTHNDVVADFLKENYDRFFALYEQLLTSENYATQRQSLKLLSEILMARENVYIMFQYVTSAKNLMLIMNLLRATSRSIQYEAFHVFKVFVANPKKPDTVKGILISNREKLLRFLKQFLEDREADDEDFANEKADIMSEIESLEHDDPRFTLKASPSMVAGQMKTVMSFGSIGEARMGSAGGSRHLDTFDSGRSRRSAASHLPLIDDSGRLETDEGDAARGHGEERYPNPS